MLNSTTGVVLVKKGPYENFLLMWNDFVCSPLQGLITCLEFSIEIESNNLMYNKNEEIRNRELPIKIDRFKDEADKDMRKMSNIVENLIRRYVESRV